MTAGRQNVHNHSYVDIFIMKGSFLLLGGIIGLIT